MASSFYEASRERKKKLNGFVKQVSREKIQNTNSNIIIFSIPSTYFNLSYIDFSYYAGWLEKKYKEKTARRWKYYISCYDFFVFRERYISKWHIDCAFTIQLSPDMKFALFPNNNVKHSQLKIFGSSNDFFLYAGVAYLHYLLTWALTCNLHITEYCRNMSEIFPIFYCNWNLVATFLSNITKYFIATFQF